MASTNPYESPQPAPEERPPPAAPPREKSLIWLPILVVATFGGGLMGNYLASLIALIFGWLPRRSLQSISPMEIAHPLGLALLVVGCLAAAYAVIRVSDHSVTQPTIYEE